VVTRNVDVADVTGAAVEEKEEVKEEKEGVKEEKEGEEEACLVGWVL